MKTLLITGFEPFGGENINPAWEAVKLLPDNVGSYHLYKQMIPTVFAEAAWEVMRVAEQLRPDVILCVGQAGGRSAVTPERIGINLRKASIPDNKGNQPQGEQIVLDGADGIFATVPVEEMAEAICRAGVPGQVSNTAGTFVCNDTLYTLLHHYQGSGTSVGFIHVPYLPQQGQPNMTLESIVKALVAAISAI